MKPILLQLNEFKLYSYPLFMGLAWGLAYQFAMITFEKCREDSKGFNLYAIGLFIFSWIGAKLLFLLVSLPGGQSEIVGSSSFWLGGGFVFYGGLIFGSLYSVIYIHFFKRFSWAQLPFVVPALSFGHAVGRMGCFLAGCCYGTQCELPWSIHLHGMNRHPVQLYEVLFSSFAAIFFFQLLKKGKRGPVVIPLYLISYSGFRFGVEYLRGDIVRGVFFMGMSTSQLIALTIFLGSCIYLVFWGRKSA